MLGNYLRLEGLSQPPPVILLMNLQCGQTWWGGSLCHTRAAGAACLRKLWGGGKSRTRRQLLGKVVRSPLVS